MEFNLIFLDLFAEKFPKLINEIQDCGHEIASHSFSHIDLRKVSKDEIEKDLVKSFNVIESVTGEKVLGFRAPFFSIDSSNSVSYTHMTLPTIYSV